MSGPKVHKIEFRNNKPGTLSTGRNTEILMDGKPISGVVKATYVISSTGVGVLTLEMIADLTIVQDVADFDVVYTSSGKLFDYDDHKD